jgi:membrane protease YdiL (CAAX protease family)
MRGLILRIWSSWFGETVERVEAEAERFRASPAGQKTDSKIIWVLVVAAISLTMQNYTSHAATLTPISRFCERLINGPEEVQPITHWLMEITYDDFFGLVWWTLVTVFWYVVPPVLLIKGVFRERIRDYGVKLAGWSAGWKIYLVFVVVMVPLVYGFSAESRFQETYPFYPIRTRAEVDAKVLAWEVLYAIQFLALEFFMRGFLVHGLKHRFGIYSVFVMTVPYCMIHFRKPFPECMASIIAGIALGFMSLKTKSVWLGAALHVSVAWGMDFCSLHRQGLIG